MNLMSPPLALYLISPQLHIMLNFSEMLRRSIEADSETKLFFLTKNTPVTTLHVYHITRQVDDTRKCCFCNSSRSQGEGTQHNFIFSMLLHFFFNRWPPVPDVYKK